MSDSTSQEPTMEEILASIRRIISEDDAPAAEAEAEPAAVAEPEPPLVYSEPEPEPAFEAQPEPVAEAPAEEEDDVLDLTEPVAQAPAESIGDLDVFEAAPPAPEPASAPAQPIYTPPAAPAAAAESLVSAPAAAAAVSAFSQLSQRVGMPAPTSTLDDVVRELLKPLLADWLDRNLAGIVQAKVDEEVERLARRLR
jgi:cell pole-organizing protein PopZ